MAESQGQPGQEQPTAHRSNMMQEIMNRAPVAGMDFVLGAVEHLDKKLRFDSKTGLLNQESWTEQLKTTVESLGENDIATVFIMDMNGFKEVNDTLGHPKGDELLGIVGQALKDSYRRTDEVATHGQPRSADPSNNSARLGGDEFALATVFRNQEKGTENRALSTPDENAQNEIKRLNKILAEAIAGTEFEKFGPTLAIGYEFAKKGDNINKVVAQADTNMYAVKYAGKIEKLTFEDLKFLSEHLPKFEELGVRIPDWMTNVVNAFNQKQQNEQNAKVAAASTDQLPEEPAAS